MREIRQKITPFTREQFVKQAWDHLNEAENGVCKTGEYKKPEDEDCEVISCKEFVCVESDHPLLLANILNREGNVLLLQARFWNKKSQALSRQSKERKEEFEDNTENSYFAALSKYEDSKRFATQAGNHILGIKTSLNYIQAVQFGIDEKVDQEQPDKKVKNVLEFKDKQGKTIFQRLEDLPNSHDKAFALISLAQLLRKLPSSVMPKKGMGQQVTLDKQKIQKKLLVHKLLMKAFQVAETKKEDISDDDRLAMAYAKGELAELYAEQQRYQEAVQLARQAIFHAQFYFPELLFRLEQQLGKYFNKQGQAEKAIGAYKRAVKHLQQMHNKYESISQSVHDLEKDVFYELVDLLLKKVSKASTDQQKFLLKEAIDTIESFKKAELRKHFQDECIFPQEKEAIKMLSSSNTAVFYYLVLEERVELLLLTSNQRMKRLPPLLINGKVLEERKDED